MNNLTGLKIMTLDLNIPWVEKYRPQSLEDIVSQNIAIKNIKEFVKSGDMPHMIFTGPAGTGKTSTALIIAKNLLKNDNYYRNLLELNASDTVRMEYVRDVIKDFVNQEMVISENNLKIVILDEADNIPGQVQQALRRIIEITSSRVKFILLCNYLDKIIDPIISRCAVFRFVDLTKEKVVERLQYIAQRENLKIPKKDESKFFDTLFFISGGDLRKAINTFQMAVALDLIENLNVNEILKITGFIDEETLNKLQNAFKTKSLTKTKEILDSIENFDSRNLIRQILELISELDLTNENRNSLFEFIGEVDYRISQGADDKIQLIALFADIIEKLK